jgi:hypothetical protein
MLRSLVALAAAFLPPVLGVAAIEPYPATFHTMMIQTNGTSLYVRLGGKRTGRCPAAWIRGHR